MTKTYQEGECSTEDTVYDLSWCNIDARPGMNVGPYLQGDAQDNWARAQGYNTVTFKTLNRHRAMLQFALRRGFNIIQVEPRATEEEYRIWLRRKL